MRNDYIRIALQGFEIFAAKAAASLRGRQQRACLSDEAVAFRRCWWLFGGQRLVDQHYQFGKLVQPSEPRIVQHQAEPLAALGDALDIALVARALGIEQRLVKLEQAVAKLGQAVAGRHSAMVSRYGWRSAAMGSMREARRAGRYPARAAAASSTLATVASVGGSVGETP